MCVQYMYSLYAHVFMFAQVCGQEGGVCYDVLPLPSPPWAH